MKSTTQHFSLGLIAVAVVTLTACGGGGGSTPGAAASSTIAGVAATGHAIPNGTVSLKCAVGTTKPVATDVDGAFVVDITGVTLPCLARVDYTDAKTGKPAKLHSLVTKSGTANITTVTDMLVTTLTKGKATVAYDNFDPMAMKKLTDSDVKAGSTAVKTYLHDHMGVNTSKLSDDLVGTKFVAKSSQHDGDDSDKILDDVKAKHGTKSDDEFENELIHVITTPPVVVPPPVVVVVPPPVIVPPPVVVPPPVAASAVNGKALYATSIGSGLPSCSICHTTMPINNISKILNGANNPAKIAGAITAGTGGMGMFVGKFTTQNLNDIAAYLATPTI